MQLRRVDRHAGGGCSLCSGRTIIATTTATTTTTTTTTTKNNNDNDNNNDDHTNANNTTSNTTSNDNLSGQRITPELTKVTIHWKAPLTIHCRIPVKIRWASDNPLENTTDK